MSARRTTGVPMLARPRRYVVELHVRRSRALGDLVLSCVMFGLLVLVAAEMWVSLFRWVGQ
jgi:hypothetical protein